MNRPTVATSAPRSPGLDGLRALAVLAVIAFHGQLAAFPGGFLGVDVFFVLSGYLITDLLVARWNRHGRLLLGPFWARRARRLLPALAVVLVVVTAATAIIEPGQLVALRQALLGAVSYSSNWWQAIGHESYFAQWGPPAPLQHLWSLAIEEQFYLVWPLLLILVLRLFESSRVRAAVAWVAAAGSAAAMALLYQPGTDPSRVYYGTDTHSAALLIGAALALSWPLRRVQGFTRENARAFDAAGLAGIVVLGWAMGHFAGSDASLYPYGLLIAALGAGGVVLAAASTGVVSWALSWGPLRWLGARSYGVYLWHWPVIALTAAVLRVPSPSLPFLLADAVLAIGLAAASWRWVEQPILRDGFRATVRRRSAVVTTSFTAARRSPTALLPPLAAAAAAAVVVTAGYSLVHARSAAGLAEQISQGMKVSQQDQAAPRPAPSTPTASGPATVPSGPSSPTPDATPGTAAPSAPAPVPVSGSQVIAIGDSVMLASAPQLQHALPGISIDAQVSRQASVGVSIVQHLAATGGLRPVLVFGLGTNGSFTMGQVRQLRAAIGPQRKLVLINNYEARPWEAGDNHVIAAAARRFRNVVLANWHAVIEHRTGLLWPDEVHPRPAGARLYARVVARAVRTAVAGRSQARAALALPPVDRVAGRLR